MEKVTLVIQGPLHHHAANKLLHYAKLFENIIISCWDYDEVKSPHEMATVRRALDTFPKFKLVKSTPPNVNFHNYQNSFFQTLTSLNGLHLVDTEFAIKTRCDEFFLGIERFSREIIENPEFIINTNIFFRPDVVCKFHSSDHLIGGKTSTLKKAFHKLHNDLLNNTYNEPVETLITKSLLLAKNVALDYSNSREIMKNNFKILRLCNLGEIMVRHSCGGTTNRFFTNEHDVHVYDPVPHINTVEEI